MNVKLMKAPSEQPALRALRYPYLASPKLDGNRACVLANGELRGYSMLSFPNLYVNRLFSRPELAGYDGELVVGDPCARDEKGMACACRTTTGALARRDWTPDVAFYVFDNFLAPGAFEHRNASLEESERVIVLEQVLIHHERQLLAYEEKVLAMGYEGVILRSLTGPYKHGRATLGENTMLKRKPFLDSEFRIHAVVEEQSNDNARVTNLLGRGQRSTAKAGLRGTGRAGALTVSDIHGLWDGQPFSVGLSTDADKAWFWVHRFRRLDQWIGKYKYQASGSFQKPRNPIYLGPRGVWDMAEPTTITTKRRKA